MEAQGLSAGRWPQVFLAFLRLGLTSFGGPIAHIGYFREAFVSRRRWIDEQPFAELLALCQLLPGPSSSQMGMAIGFTRAGWKGALAAWIAFTLPSAALMVGFAWGLRWVDAGAGWLHGLKLAAVAVVAQAVLQMARQFAVGAPRLMMAVLAGLACAASGGAIVQPGVIVAGALLGPLAIRDARPLPAEEDRPVVGRRTGLALLLVCAALLVVVPLAGDLLASPALRQLGAYIRAGALVFGGGHVVLPLLEQGVTATGAADRNAFLAAYGAAQALPGPLFAIAAFPGWLGEPARCCCSECCPSGRGSSPCRAPLRCWRGRMRRWWGCSRRRCGIRSGGAACMGRWMSQSRRRASSRSGSCGRPRWWWWPGAQRPHPSD
jgi:chromate transporter